MDLGFTKKKTKKTDLLIKQDKKNKANKTTYEADNKEDAQDIKTAFEIALAKEKSRSSQNSNADYYCIMYFQNGNQAQAFFEALQELAPKVKCPIKKYINGETLAKALNIELPEVKEEERIRIEPFAISKYQEAKGVLPMDYYTDKK